MEVVAVALFGLFGNKCRQTLYFKNGQLYKIIGNQENWYDPKYIVSDGVKYDMSNPQSIKSIRIPAFGISDVMSGYGPTGMLDYVLRMKAGNCFNRNEYALCSVLLWKSTELMFENKHCNWKQSDFERLINWHREMGMEEEAEKAKKYLEEKDFIIIPQTNKKRHVQTESTKKPTVPKITTAEKERAIVKMTTAEHMQLLSNFPFAWNDKIKKNLSPNSHAYCYMNIIGENISLVKSELEFMNKIIRSDLRNYKDMPDLKIPIASLVFQESDKQGHTKFICWPITLSGKVSKYPLTLFFTTRLQPGKDSTHGEIIYGQNCKIQKANIYFWRNGQGYFLYYKTVDGVLTLYKLDRA